MNLIDYITENYPYILSKTGDHISLALVAVGFSCLIGIPLGILITRNKKFADTVIGIANVIQTVPSLALFAFMLPLFGIGYRNAVFALFLYALLPIIKNTYIGIKNVDPAIIEAARGMGMSKLQILSKVEMPLCIAVIMGGVRIATVTCIGVATIATLIGAGGLGDIIYQGIGMVNYNMILSGAISAALLALAADFILGLFEKMVTSKGIAIK
ncbi:MAG: ABC transporter permease [Saccharofermentanales bacterium]